MERLQALIAGTIITIASGCASIPRDKYRAKEFAQEITECNTLLEQRLEPKSARHYEFGKHFGRAIENLVGSDAVLELKDDFLSIEDECYLDQRSELYAVYEKAAQESAIVCEQVVSYPHKRRGKDSGDSIPYVSLTELYERVKNIAPPHRRTTYQSIAVTLRPYFGWLVR